MRTTRPTFGFTLIELLVVISILGLLAGLAVPAIKNLGKSNVNISAARQLLDDIARARQLALSQRTTVYMVFVDTNFWNSLPNAAALASAAVTNLCDKQLTGYTFVTLRSVGDQPGRGNPNYLNGWQSLPAGDFIASWKFLYRTIPPTYTAINDIVDSRTYAIQGFYRTSANFIPFPAVNSAFSATNLPYIAFNYLGQLTTEQLSPEPSQVDEYIPLAQGTVAPATDPSTKTYRVGPVNSMANAPAVTEIPSGNSTNSSYNLIHIDWLTGRAREEVQQLK